MKAIDAAQSALAFGIVKNNIVEARQDDTLIKLRMDYAAIADIYAGMTTAAAVLVKQKITFLRFAFDALAVFFDVFFHPFAPIVQVEFRRVGRYFDGVFFYYASVLQCTNKQHTTVNTFTFDASTVYMWRS